MPFFTTSQEWLEQSSLLLKARPSTARTSTKYSVKPLKKRKKRHTGASDIAGQEVAAASSTPSDPIYKATFTVKTYDPVSGVCLKYETTESKEVGRIMASLGRLGRIMAALPDAPMAEETKTVDVADDTLTLPGSSKEPKDAHSKPAQNNTSTGGGGASKKKKKAKK